MRFTITNIVLIFNLISLFSSELGDTLLISKTPTNICQVNSKYDDFNSAIFITPIFMSRRLIFSTNRFSQGQDFDLISYKLDLVAKEKEQRKYNIGFTANIDDNLIKFDAINSKCSEFGPYFIKFNPTYNKPGTDSVLFFLSKDCNSNLDIYYANYQYESFIPEFDQPIKLWELDKLNTPYDEGYVSISMDFKNLYYCTNREGSFNIMAMFDSSGSDIYQILTKDIPFQINALEKVNSTFDDKCPFIHWNDWLVFCSNRTGGYGGYDLYYAIRENNQWSSPKNFGEKINSKYDEFRPIILEGRFMIFSSNRPNGKGGYDLYIVEIEW